MVASRPLSTGTQIYLLVLIVILFFDVTLDQGTFSGNTGVIPVVEKFSREFSLDQGFFVREYDGKSVFHPLDCIKLRSRLDASWSNHLGLVIHKAVF